jgi:nucleoside-diphosphate-sugar epimerase
MSILLLLMSLWFFIVADGGVLPLLFHPPFPKNLYLKGSLSPLRGDLRDPASLAQGARQADAVIHAATANSSDMAEADIAAVDAILTALVGSNKPFIYTSGCWVLGSSGDTIADEESPTDPPAIVAWRPALERRILAAAERGVHSLVLRPANVYGRAGGIPAMLINLARQYGAAHYIGAGENHCPMVQVDGLADAYVRALTRAPTATLVNVPGGPVFQRDRPGHQPGGGSGWANRVLVAGDLPAGPGTAR